MQITQSLPNIVKVFTIPCASLAPNVVEKYMAGLPVGVYPLPTEVEHYGTGSVESENVLDEGTYYEKTTLQFSTAEDIRARVCQFEVPSSTCEHRSHLLRFERRSNLCAKIRSIQ